MYFHRRTWPCTQRLCGTTRPGPAMTTLCSPHHPVSHKRKVNKSAPPAEHPTQNKPATCQLRLESTLPLDQPTAEWSTCTRREQTQGQHRQVISATTITSQRRTTQHRSMSSRWQVPGMTTCTVKGWGVQHTSATTITPRRSSLLHANACTSLDNLCGCGQRSNPTHHSAANVSSKLRNETNE